MKTIFVAQRSDESGVPPGSGGDEYLRYAGDPDNVKLLLRES